MYRRKDYKKSKTCLSDINVHNSLQDDINFLK